jgi:phosphodiesterase/alkaline phosphatase D-like protein
MFGRLWLAASMPGDIDILGLRLTKQKWANPHTGPSFQIGVTPGRPSRTHQLQQTKVAAAPCDEKENSNVEFEWNHGEFLWFTMVKLVNSWFNG